MSWIIVLWLVTGELIWQPSTEKDCRHVVKSLTQGAHVSATLPDGTTVDVRQVTCMRRDGDDEA